MTSLISDETDYKFSDICKSDDKRVHDGNWVSHPTTTTTTTTTSAIITVNSYCVASEKRHVGDL